MYRVSAALCLAVFLFASAMPANSPESIASYGGAVAVGDGYLFVAEPGGFKNPGMVHVYLREKDQSWILRTSLQGPNAQVGDGFGSMIAYGGGALAVAGQSALYVFEQQNDPGSFVQTAKLNPEMEGKMFTSVSLDGEWLALGIAVPSGDDGQVHLFRRNLEGEWISSAILDEPGDVQQSMYGTALAMNQGRLAVGAPMASVVYLYTYRDDAWGLDTTLLSGELGEESAYGAALDLQGDFLAVGAPRHNSGAGAVKIWHGSQAGWTESQVLSPQESRQFFGLQIKILDSQWIVVSAPMARDMAGEVRIYSIQEDGTADPEYTGIQRAGPRFGSVVAGDDLTIAVGIPGAAYGEGSTQLIEWKEMWVMTQELFNEGESMPRKAQMTCDSGQASGFDCELVDLVSFLPNQDMEMSRGVRLSDVWGWTDPETGIEYGLVGHLEGTVFIDLSNPSMPRYLGTLPRTEGSPGSTWRDIKVYKDHAFIVADGAGEHGMQVFDLTQLRALSEIPVEFAATVHYDRIHSAHNIVINEETGFAFAVGASAGGETCGGGLHMIDIREPQSPAFVGCFADETTGRRKTGYSHDAQCVIYNGPDTEYAGREICFGANETAISISDVTDKQNPVAIGTGSYPDAAYVHQGWLTEDHAYFFQNDELDELAGKVEKTRTLIWDVRDLSDPVMIREIFGPTSATDHNLYVHGDLMYQTNNASGLRIIDVSTPEDPVEIGYFDTTPYGTDEAGFNGTWSSYPYFESGIIVVTSRREGVFILRKQPIDI